MFKFIYYFFLFLAKFSQADISEIVPELKSNIDETINSYMIKSQKINNCKSQDNFTTPKKSKISIIGYYYVTTLLIIIVTL